MDMTHTDQLAGTADATGLRGMAAGFDDPVHDSQALFRAALQALSEPGRPVGVTPPTHTPPPGQPAAAALLLALLDADCSLWLSPSLAAGGAGPWLRFHTGCRLVDDPGEAQFCWAAGLAELPPLDRLAQGSDEDPDRSATCVLDVAALRPGAEGAWRFSGPGIRTQASVEIDGLDAGAADFAVQCAANHAAFPRGVDLLLADARRIMGLPRSTRVEYRRAG